MAFILFLLQPYFTRIRIWIIRRYNFFLQTTVMRHAIIGVYLMILIMLLDSTYRWNKSESLILTYQNQKNFYLCLFTLFLSLVINKLCNLLESTFKTDQLNKKTIKQSGNSRIFLNSLIEDHNLQKQKLEYEINTLKEELEKLRENKTERRETEASMVENSDSKELERCKSQKPFESKKLSSEELDEWDNDFIDMKTKREPLDNSKFEYQHKSDPKKGFTFLDKGN